MEEERFDLGHTVKKIFAIGIVAWLIFIGFIALMTLVGIVIAIPLLKKSLWNDVVWWWRVMFA
ncbi:hypothetical protein [Listeria rocourtiae]|uniref:hypothetical protein n=1 Tax=Listeria rocourtiae TaxID=647910 RepID=UPI0003E8508D|nr:hypothetical protein [Listeria rocourtiae]EUJ46177.1 hypothetical protein PROCOU_11548 [Listeria rocourtiae FSL F6-920]